MNETQFLVILLIVIIIGLLVLTSLIRKKIETETINKFKNFEQEEAFKEKLTKIKNEIDVSNQSSFEEKTSERISYYISDAIRRSGSVTKGKVIEHFAPFLTPDDISPYETVFMGSPIDLISFKNIDNENELRIDFLEIKSGNSTLSKKQKLIKHAVSAKKVYYKKVTLQ